MADIEIRAQAFWTHREGTDRAAGFATSEDPEDGYVLFEGVAGVEALAYRRLADLGAPPQLADWALKPQGLLLVTGRLPVDDLWCDLAGYPNLARVGDCLAPSSIADAVHSAHRYVRLLGEPDLPPRRERPSHRSM